LNKVHKEPQRLAKLKSTALRARNLAQDVGCAVGAIYNVFGDLTGLVLAVNARTFESPGVAVSNALSDAPSVAVEQLVIMSQAYHHFAAEHHNLWPAMFDVDGPLAKPRLIGICAKWVG
jgi:hypothetical protein